MQTTNSFTGKLLVSMPSTNNTLLGGNVVIYICDHDFSGATGLMINKPSDYTLGELLDKMRVTLKNVDLADELILIGGLDQKEKGFILSSVEGEIVVSTAKEILEDLAAGLWMPDNFLIALGCVNWPAGELEREMAANCWLVVPVSDDILFDDPFTARWYNAGLSMGVNLDIVPSEAGRA